MPPRKRKEPEKDEDKKEQDSTHSSKKEDKPKRVTRKGKAEEKEPEKEPEKKDEPTTSTTSNDSKDDEDDAGSAEPLSKKLKDAWKWEETVMYWESDDIKHSDKIASFDFDGCLANTSLFKKGPDAWSILFPGIPDKLKSLHKEGYKLIIFTNQSDIGKAAKPETREKAINEKKGRLMGFVQMVGLPFQIFVSTAKTTVADKYRKPAIGMWEFLRDKMNGGVKIDMAKSFFVGDAAGRKRDHSDSDIKFAAAVGLTFHTEEYFKT